MTDNVATPQFYDVDKSRYSDEPCFVVDRHGRFVKRDDYDKLLTACGRRTLRFQDGSTDESFSGLQWAEVRQDAERVLAEAAAALLREGEKP